jgi:hypothetical protein
MEMWTETRRQGNPSTRDFVGAEDGIRTRDPQLGKVFEIVHGVLASPLNWASRLRNFRRIRPSSTLL